MPVVIYCEMTDAYLCHVCCHLKSDKAQRVEVDEMLRSMLDFEQNDSAQIALVAHCLAMLWFLGEDFQKVR